MTLGSPFARLAHLCLPGSSTATCALARPSWSSPPARRSEELVRPVRWPQVVLHVALTDSRPTNLQCRTCLASPATRP